MHQLFTTQIACLSFINCLINTPEHLADREEIRAEFLRLGLSSLVKVGLLLRSFQREQDIKQKERILAPELKAQIEVFEEFSVQDEEEFAQRFGKRPINLKYFSTPPELIPLQ